MKSVSLISFSLILLVGALATQICLGQQQGAAPVIAGSVEAERSRPDPIEWIQHHWKGALRTVTLTDAVEIPLIVDGETIGSAMITKNTELPIRSIDSETITVEYMHSLHELPHAATNIRELAERGIDFTLAHATQPPVSHTTQDVTDVASSSSGYSKSQATGRFPKKFPRFSWDRVPVYKMFGDSKGLTDEQAQFIAATTDFVCFEKHHGSKKYKTVEDGTKHDIAKLKDENPTIKALMYFNASILWPNGSYVRALFNTEQLQSYYRAPLKKEFEGWAMQQKDGTPYTRGDSKFRQFFMNIANPGYQKWWVESAVKGVNYTEADGIYIDAFWIPTFLMKHNDLTDEDSNRARKEILDALKSRLGPDKIIFINQGYATGILLDGGEGFMFENYKPENCTPEEIIKDWKQMKVLHDAGKLSVWRIGVNNTGDAKDESMSWEARSEELATFWTAAFLIGAQEYSYLQYGWGFQLLKGGSLVDYPEFKARLGAPMGEYVQNSEFEFTRSFKYADVWVDLQNHTATIDWK